MYQVDCRKIGCYEDFVDAINRGLVEHVGGKWNGNLNAFNDYLAWPETTPYRLVIIGSDRCAEVLGYKANGPDEADLWSILKEILEDNSDLVTVEFN
jgi:hypothetical protein